MNKKLIKFNLNQRNSKKVPELKAGDVVKVHRKIKEGNKERIQIFEGIIIAIKGKQSSSPMITVRKVSNGVGVELVLPIYSPNVEKIELVKRAKVRRSKLYYIRNKSAKSMRLKYQDLADFAQANDKKDEDSEIEADKEGDKDGGEKSEKKDKSDKAKDNEEKEKTETKNDKEKNDEEKVKEDKKEDKEDESVNKEKTGDK